MAQIFSSSYSLIKKVPVRHIDETISHLGSVIRDEEIMLQIGQRLDHAEGIDVCEGTGKAFIQCTHNKDGESFRSPWSNRYQPAFDEGIIPPEFLRNLEVLANEAFELYARLYYQEACTSVYFLDTNPNEFVCVLLVKKEANSHKKMKSGAWDSCHIVTTKMPPDSKNVTYHYASTINVQFEYEFEARNQLDVSCSITKQGHETKQIENDLYGEKHVHNIIGLVETIEGQLRIALEQVYIGKADMVAAQCRRVKQTHKKFGLPKRNR